MHFLESSTQQHIVIWIAIYFVWLLESSVFISIYVHYFNPFSNHLILASLIFIFSYISIKNREQKKCFQQLTMSGSKMAFWCAMCTVHCGNFLAHPNGIAILLSSAHILSFFYPFFPTLNEDNLLQRKPWNRSANLWKCSRSSVLSSGRFLKKWLQCQQWSSLPSALFYFFFWTSELL